MPQILNVEHILLSGGTAAALSAANPTPAKFELMIESDTRKFKVGDGVTAWADLDYASASPGHVDNRAPLATDVDYDVGTVWVYDTATPSQNKAYVLTHVSGGAATWRQIVTPEDLAELGGGDMLAAQYATNPKTAQGYVNAAIIADKWATARTVTVGGDVTGTASVDGSQNISLPLALADIAGLTPGTYTRVTVDAKGRVTGAEALTAADLPSIPTSKITGIGTAATRDVGIASGNVPLIGADGKLNEAVIPQMAITEVHPVASKAAMLALSAHVGSVAVITAGADMGSYILSALPASTEANWVRLAAPQDAVLSVNGLTGAVVLTTDNVTEGGANLYFTGARAAAAFDASFAAKSSTGLADGAAILRSTDSYVIRGVEYT